MYALGSGMALEAHRGLPVKDVNGQPSGDSILLGSVIVN
jgi:hypothetical protein